MLCGYTSITDGHLDVALYMCNEPVCYEHYFFSCLCLQTHKMSSVSFMSVIALERLVDCGGGQFPSSHLADLRRSPQSSLAAYKHRKAEKTAGRVSPSLSRSPPSYLVCSTLVNCSTPSSIANLSTDATPSGYPREHGPLLPLEPNILAGTGTIDLNIQFLLFWVPSVTLLG